MNSLPKKLSALILIGLATTLLLSASPLFASDRLRSFTVTETTDGKVRLEWVTSTEADVLEFYIKRVPNSASNFTDIFFYGDPADDTQIIPLEYEGSVTKAIFAQGNPAAGHTYVAIDHDVIDGEKYVYMLVQLEADGRYQPADDTGEQIKRITIGASTQIYLPIIHQSAIKDTSSLIYLPIIHK